MSTLVPRIRGPAAPYCGSWATIAPVLDGCVPHPPEMVQRYVARGYWRGLGFTDLLDRQAGGRPQDVAVVAGDRRLTWRELSRQSDHLARHLLARGLRPRDRVILQLPNVPEFLIVYLALARSVGKVSKKALREAIARTVQAERAGETPR